MCGGMIGGWGSGMWRERRRCRGCVFLHVPCGAPSPIPLHLPSPAPCTPRDHPPWRTHRRQVANIEPAGIGQVVPRALTGPEPRAEGCAAGSLRGQVSGVGASELCEEAVELLLHARALPWIHPGHILEEEGRKGRVGTRVFQGAQSLHQHAATRRRQHASPRDCLGPPSPRAITPPPPHPPLGLLQVCAPSHTAPPLSGRSGRAGGTRPAPPAGTAPPCGLQVGRGNGAGWSIAAEQPAAHRAWGPSQASSPPPAHLPRGARARPAVRQSRRHAHRPGNVPG